MDVSISTASSIDNTPVHSSKYSLLAYLSIDTSYLIYDFLRVIKLKNMMKEVTSVSKIIILKWILIIGVVVEKVIIKFPTSGYLRYNRFK